MNFLLDPPTRSQPGAVLSPPVVVKVDKPFGKINSKDTGLLWAFVSVTDEAGRITLAPPRNDLVVGSLSDSIHKLESETGSDEEDGLGFLSFPNLAIKDPGNYRLRISLMKHDTTGRQGATNLQTISSPVIRVAKSAQPIRLGKEQVAVLDSLRQRGLRVGS